MRAKAGLAVGVAALALGPAAADAGRVLSYQGFTSQGHEIKFKRSKAGVFSMAIGYRASCVNDQGQNQGDYDFAARALDKVADTVKRGRFTVKLAGNAKLPATTITGRINKNGVARGTFTASGRVTSPDDIGTCSTGTVRFTAGP